MYIKKIIVRPSAFILALEELQAWLKMTQQRNKEGELIETDDDKAFNDSKMAVLSYLIYAAAFGERSIHVPEELLFDLEYIKEALDNRQMKLPDFYQVEQKEIEPQLA